MLFSSESEALDYADLSRPDTAEWLDADDPGENYPFPGHILHLSHDIFVCNVVERSEHSISFRGYVCGISMDMETTELSQISSFVFYREGDLNGSYLLLRGNLDSFLRDKPREKLSQTSQTTGTKRLPLLNAERASMWTRDARGRLKRVLESGTEAMTTRRSRTSA